MPVTATPPSIAAIPMTTWNHLDHAGSAADLAPHADIIPDEICDEGDDAQGGEFATGVVPFDNK